MVFSPKTVYILDKKLDENLCILPIGKLKLICYNVYRKLRESKKRGGKKKKKIKKTLDFQKKICYNDYRKLSKVTIVNYLIREELIICG